MGAIQDNNVAAAAAITGYQTHNFTWGGYLKKNANAASAPLLFTMSVTNRAQNVYFRNQIFESTGGGGVAFGFSAQMVATAGTLTGVSAPCSVSTTHANLYAFIGGSQGIDNFPTTYWFWVATGNNDAAVTYINVVGAGNPLTVSQNYGRFGIGHARITGTQGSTGYEFYWAGLWNDRLALEEINALTNGIHPYKIRPRNLAVYTVFNRKPFKNLLDGNNWFSTNVTFTPDTGTYYPKLGGAQYWEFGTSAAANTPHPYLDYRGDWRKRGMRGAWVVSNFAGGVVTHSPSAPPVGGNAFSMPVRMFWGYVGNMR